MVLSKKELIAKIIRHELTECHQYVQKLITVLINDARRRNDTATGDDLYRNQGAVKELKQLLKSIQTHEIQRGLDGAYGE